MKYLLFFLLFTPAYSCKSFYKNKNYPIYDLENKTADTIIITNISEPYTFYIQTNVNDAYSIQILASNGAVLAEPGCFYNGKNRKIKIEVKNCLSPNQLPMNTVLYFMASKSKNMVLIKTINLIYR